MINDLDLPIEAINEIATSGRNDRAVKHWCEMLEFYYTVKRRDAFEAVKAWGLYTPQQLKNMRTHELIECAVWDLAWNRFESLDEVTE